MPSTKPLRIGKGFSQITGKQDAKSGDHLPETWIKLKEDKIEKLFEKDKFITI